MQTAQSIQKNAQYIQEKLNKIEKDAKYNVHTKTSSDAHERRHGCCRKQYAKYSLCKMYNAQRRLTVYTKDIQSAK